MKMTTMRPIALATSIALVVLTTASGAAPRDEVLEVLEQVMSSGGGLNVWANDGDGLPLEEGTPIAFHFESKDDVHLTAMYLDADGNLLLLYPAPTGTALQGGKQLDLMVGEATTPYGQESLFVVASEQPITREALGISSMDEYARVGHDEAVAVAERLRDIVASGGGVGSSSARVDLHIVPGKATGQGYTRGGIIQYFTEATRSLHRPKLALDINFESGSSDLRDDVRGDLDVVGAALSDERLRDKRLHAGWPHGPSGRRGLQPDAFRVAGRIRPAVSDRYLSDRSRAHPVQGLRRVAAHDERARCSRDEAQSPRRTRAGSLAIRPIGFRAAL